MENIETNWQDQKPQQRMEYLQKTGHLSDCSFVVYDDNGEKLVLKCHKFVLMSVSPVFERMFEGDFEESKMSENIVLDDVSGTDFQKFISYLYWHDNKKLCDYELQTIQSLIYLSKKFMIPSFTSKCLQAIKQRLSKGLDPDTIVELFQYAHDIEDSDLIEAIQQLFTSNPSLYIKTAAVFELSSDRFTAFIRQFRGKLEEKRRFEVVDRYCNIHALHLKNEKTNEEATEFFEIEAILPSTESAADEKKDENENEVKLQVNDKQQSNQNGPKTKDQRMLEKKIEFITTLMEEIKFTSMTSYDFIAGPGASDLLSVEKKYELLSAICIANDKSHVLRVSNIYK